MFKSYYLLTVICIACCAISCGEAKNKADASAGKEKNNSGKIQDNISAPAAKPDSFSLRVNNNDILEKIDQYLVSTPVYTKPAAGGSISNAVVTVKNTLADITFQKAIVEITILSSEGKMLKNNFYPIQNIEPGDVETIKIPNTNKAASIVSHVVKVKSNTLTNGEMVIVGNHSEPGK